MRQPINIVVEGLLDEAVAKKIVFYTGHQVGTVYGRQGWTYIKEKITGFNKASRFSPFLVLVDFMDTGLACPGELCPNWVPDQSPLLILRGVQREIESWLLADREAIAAYFNINTALIPQDPESLGNPKLSLVNLARRSRMSSRRSAIVPVNGATGQTGLLYVSEMTRFVENQWSVEQASKNAPSLAKCIHRLRAIV